MKSAVLRYNERMETNEKPETLEPGEAPRETDLVLKENRDAVNGAVNDVIDLGIDWKALDKKELFKKMDSYDSSGNGDFAVCEIPSTSGKKLELQFSKSTRGWRGSKDVMSLNLVRPDCSKDDWSKYYAGTFDFARFEIGETEDWNMKHRETGNLYRQQGIASEILKLFEEYVSQREKPQVVSAEVGQPDLIYWLENKKRGYSPARKLDTINLMRFKNKDPDLQIFTSTGGEKYLFDMRTFRSKYGCAPDDTKVWDPKNYKEDFFYMNSSFRIKFKKKIA